MIHFISEFSLAVRSTGFMSAIRASGAVAAVLLVWQLTAEAIAPDFLADK